MLTIAQAFDMAVQHHQGGRVPQAEQLYRQILQVDPQHVGALHLLGLLCHQVGRSELAIEYIGQALRIQPEFAEAAKQPRNRTGKAGKAAGGGVLLPAGIAAQTGPCRCSQ